MRKVTELNGENKTATIKSIHMKDKEAIDFDFCIIAAGCNIWRSWTGQSKDYL